MAKEVKFIECTGSPKPYFSTKEVFLTEISEFGFEHGKMSKKNNKVSVLCCSDLDSNSSKMQLAKELGVEIMTYEQIKEDFDLQGDMESEE
jgi:hypothetical protein